MVETIIDTAMGALKNVLIIIGKVIYQIVVAIPAFFLWIIFLLILFFAFVMGKWIWKNRKEWRAREF